MDLTVNGEPATLAPGTRVNELVAACAGGQSRVAVAVNATVVPRSVWATTTLQPGDSVEILVPVAGG